MTAQPNPAVAVIRAYKRRTMRTARRTMARALQVLAENAVGPARAEALSGRRRGTSILPSPVHTGPGRGARCADPDLPDDAGCAEAVRLGWRLVDVHERLGGSVAGAGVAPEIAASPP